MSGRKSPMGIPEGQTRKISARGLKNLLGALGRKIFSRVHRNEVEYGQTLSKKRRKNCILKSVSSLPCTEDDSGYLNQSPYHINFQFSKEDVHFRSSVVNFQKIDMRESCCEKCFCTLKKGDTFSRFSISSDSACDVSSESSCDDVDCRYRSKVPKPVKRIKKRRNGDTVERTLENFIRIHKEHFKSETDNPVHDVDLVARENSDNVLLEWMDEDPTYEHLVAKAEDPNSDEPGYDILVTKTNCMVLEPSYENLKLIQTFYEEPQRTSPTAEGPPEVVQSNKTYDEVIESLKLWHLNLRYPNCSCCCEKADNEMNHYAEGYESLENDLNNDIEEFCC